MRTTPWLPMGGSQGVVVYIILLLRPECLDGVFLCREAGRDKSGEEREHNADDDEYHAACPRELRLEGHYAGQIVHDDVYRDIQQHRHENADKPCREPDDERLGIEHARHVLLRRADGAEYTDLLGALKHAYIRDDADHDG